MSSIAVIGAGVSGLTAAYVLGRKHEVTLFEANNYLGGHTDTQSVVVAGEKIHVDTGFIVYNDRTYPHFIQLLDQLGCPGIPTEMSFSMNRTGLEYNGHTLNSLFAQRSNVFRPSFWRMVLDILRFNKEAVSLAPNEPRTIGEYLEQEGYSTYFRHDYILPMAAAIWSTGHERVSEFPIRALAQFFENHGLLSIKNRPQWRIVEGGSQAYVEAMKPYIADARVEQAVASVSRTRSGVNLVLESGEEHAFDEVVIATHSDQALEMLTDPSTEEREILGSIHFSSNEACLHTDTSLLPSRKLAWASWNYHLTNENIDKATLTYNMNILQHIKSEETVLVTLNDDGRIDPKKVLKKIDYAHPQYNHAMLEAQQRKHEISGKNRTYYCGAYWQFGFHEDGVNSALDVCQHFGLSL